MDRLLTDYSFSKQQSDNFQSDTQQQCTKSENVSPYTVYIRTINSKVQKPQKISAYVGTLDIPLKIGQFLTIKIPILRTQFKAN